MKPMLTQRRCSVRECGAIVLIGQVEGRPMQLNPNWVDVVVPNASGELVLTRGLQPHGATCVDISARAAHLVVPAANG